MRSAVSHGDTKPLGVTHRYVGAKLTGWRQQGQSEQVGGHGHHGTAPDSQRPAAADGMVGYTEPALLDAAGSTTDVDVTLDAAAAPVDVFALHSLPSSTKVVYLDFDGHTTVGDDRQSPGTLTDGSPF